MPNNGDNEWGVSFGRIMFLNRILESHRNVTILERHDDIVFEIERSKQGDTLSIICVDPYTASVELILRILQDFPNINIIFIGGKWAGYTHEAYEMCVDGNIGIYNAGDLTGALFKNEYWNYEKLDEDGEPIKSFH